MLIIISIISVFFLSLLLRKTIKKHPNTFYLATVLISIIFIIYFSLNLNNYIPKNLNKYIFTLFSRGAISTALFTIVMYTGALNKKFLITKKLLSIRAELSIMACILTFCHNILYGKYYFILFFTNRSTMDTNKLLATILTLIMLCIMIPLFITSFTSVRKKLKYKTWKNIQRFSYLFYGLIYVHVMLLFIPRINNGRFYDILIYTFIFVFYVILRIYRYFADKK